MGEALEAGRQVEGFPVPDMYAKMIPDNEQTQTAQKLLAGSKNVRFDDLVALVEAFGFHLSRVSGSHHIFVHPDVEELVNLQKVRGKAKPFQVRQFLRLVERYHLTLEDDS